MALKKKTAKKTVAKKKTVTKKRLKTASKVKRKTTIVRCYDCTVAYDSKLGHECIPVTMEMLLSNMNRDLLDAFLTLRNFAKEMGEQRIYNSARAIMFSRRVCYMFVRPQKSYLELCFFLHRPEKDERIFRRTEVSKTKFNHTFKLVHSDQVEEPVTDWIREAFELSV